mgnify:FL=1
MTELTVETFKEMRARHMTYVQIGRKVGRSKNGVSGWAQRHGLSGARYNGMTVEQFRDMKEKQGLSYREIAAVLDIKETQVAHFARKHGLGPGRLKAKTGRLACSNGLRIKACQYIAGDPSHDDACKCGAPVQRGKPYCEAHQRRAWVKGSSILAQRKRKKKSSGNYEIQQAAF